MKTVRFSQVVARSGQPEPYTLWTARESDREFQAACQQHRVMTVHQETVGSKKDYGEVGFVPEQNGSLLIFPKSLKAFAGRRVVGVKYELLEATADAPTKRATRSEKTKAPRTRPKKKPPQPKPSSAPQIWVFRPEEANARPARPAKPTEPGNRKPALQLDQLTREVRRAMKQLQSGKAGAAFQTLEKALLKSAN